MKFSEMSHSQLKFARAELIRRLLVVGFQCSRAENLSDYAVRVEGGSLQVKYFHPNLEATFHARGGKREAGKPYNLKELSQVEAIIILFFAEHLGSENV